MVTGALPAGAIRRAVRSDVDRLLQLWEMVFDEGADEAEAPWQSRAREWFGRVVDDPAMACFPLVEAGGEVVATAIGTLELGVPNPYCPRGRTVRLANVVTVPGQRGRGHGTLLVRDVVEWARAIDADRVDLSATPDGRRLYERLGFELTTAPRMKLVL